MRKKEFPPTEALFPLPVVLVTSLNTSTDKANIVTVAWCGIVCSDPAMLSISLRPSRYSYDLIKQSREFVVNIPNSRLTEKVDICGTISGRKADKFKVCSFTPIPSSKIKTPLILECPVNIECQVKQIITLGVHDIFVSQILAVHANKDVLNAAGAIAIDKVKPVSYNLGEYRGSGGCIGKYGFSATK